MNAEKRLKRGHAGRRSRYARPLGRELVAGSTRAKGAAPMPHLVKRLPPSGFADTKGQLGGGKSTIAAVDGSCRCAICELQKRGMSSDAGARGIPRSDRRADVAYDPTAQQPQDIELVRAL